MYNSEGVLADVTFTERQDYLWGITSIQHWTKVNGGKWAAVPHDIDV
jgi:hypothetical protein